MALLGSERCALEGAHGVEYRGTEFQDGRSHAGLCHGLELTMAGWAATHRLGNAF